MKNIARKIRNHFYKLLNRLFNNSNFSKSNDLLTRSVYNTTVGSYNYLGKGVIINNTVMGNYCSVAAYTQIGGMEHNIYAITTSTKVSKPLKSEPVRIGDDVWIGAGVYVKSGVSLGRGSVIGAGAVVLTDVPAYTIVGGVPARKLRDRFSSEIKASVMGLSFSVEPKSLKEINEDFSNRR